LGTAGARFARRFDWRRASIELLGIYEDLVDAEPVSSEASS
jgi:hypothetical protein